MGFLRYYLDMGLCAKPVQSLYSALLACVPTKGQSNSSGKRHLYKESCDAQTADASVACFRRSELDVCPQDGTNIMRITVENPDLNLVTGTFGDDKRMEELMDAVTRIDFHHTFQLPPNYVRHLGEYEDLEQYPDTAAFLGWDEHGSRASYKLVVQHSGGQMDYVRQLALAIYHGEISPKLSTQKEPPTS